MKSKSQNSQLTASKLQIILSAVLVLILLSMATGFYFAYGFLRETAKVTAEKQVEAKSVDLKLQNSILLEKQMKSYEDTIRKTKQIVADSQHYQYQNQIISDLSSYADQSGVSITSFEFMSDDAATPEPAPTAPTGQAEGPQNTTGETESTPPTPAAPTLKSTEVAIRLGEENDYYNVLKFIYKIEQNITRMQVLGLSMSKGKGGNDVSVQGLNIEVYIR